MSYFHYRDIILASGLLFHLPANAQLLSSDTALLMDLVTTTASQLNELEKLVSNSEKYTKSVQEYNELVQDRYLKAQRVLYIAESVAAKKETQDLGQLNDAIGELKYSMADMNELMREYSMIKHDEKITQKKVEINKSLNHHKVNIARDQVDKSIDAKNSGQANQLTAENTAMLYESNVDMHNTQLEMLEKISTTNRLLAEEMEEKRKEQMDKEKAYGIKGAKHEYSK